MFNVVQPGSATMVTSALFMARLVTTGEHTLQSAQAAFCVIIKAATPEYDRGDKAFSALR